MVFNLVPSWTLHPVLLLHGTSFPPSTRQRRTQNTKYKIQQTPDVTPGTILPTLHAPPTFHDQVLGPLHSDTLTCVLTLARTMHAKGDLDGADAMLARALKGHEETLGPRHPRTLNVRMRICDCVFVPDPTQL